MGKKRRYAGWRGRLAWAIWAAPKGHGWTARLRESDEHGDVCWYEQQDFPTQKMARDFIEAMACVTEESDILNEGGAR